ncbi:MAG: DUF5652 family protein [Patescibacteria group bacterium]
MNTESIKFLANWAGVNPLVIISVIAWTLVWKGLALWRSASLRQKWWFIALIFINTLGILEVIYLFFVARRYRVEIVEQNE